MYGCQAVRILNVTTLCCIVVSAWNMLLWQFQSEKSQWISLPSAGSLYPFDFSGLSQITPMLRKSKTQEHFLKNSHIFTACCREYILRMSIAREHPELMGNVYKFYWYNILAHSEGEREWVFLGNERTPAEIYNFTLSYVRCGSCRSDEHWTKHFLSKRS